jgi:hypothetical protein
MQSGSKPIKYVAEVAPVKEVTLHGRAELAYWTEKLRAENLTPLAADGQAQLLISSTEARFWGILFRESLIGIHIQPTAVMPAEMPAMFLLQAWNSLSSFAWIERNLFGTPYAAGKVEVEPQLPAKLRVEQQRQTLTVATMSNEQRDATAVADENWQGAIFLPRRGSKPQQMFVAKLAGRTENYPFRERGDSLELSRSPICETIGCLIDSHFAPQTWAIRQAAAHAKSKTYRADQFFAR